jgi:hypothetical protein
MPKFVKALGLLLLLLAAQQGAVVHELSHVAKLTGGSLHQDAGSTDSQCALCPAFAQAVAPAFSHSFHVPLLLPIRAELVAELQHVAIDAAVPQARSRGPPASS